MRSSFYFLLLVIVQLLSGVCNGQIITTIAGNGHYGSSGDGGNATSASLTNAIGIVADSAGNVYFSDRDANCVRKITSDGIITNFAGGGPGGLGDGGPATEADLEEPFSLAVDAHSNIYICDQGNGRVRKVNSSGIITTIAGNGGYGASGDGGPATDAEIGNPCGIAVDKRGNVFIGSGTGLIRKVNTAGYISTYGGSPDTSGYRGDGGQATAAWIANAAGLGIDTGGNIYIADYSNNRIRKIGTDGIITTIGGNGRSGIIVNGPATATSIHWPTGLAVDLSDNVFFTCSNEVVKINTSTGLLTTVAGNDSFGFSGDGGPATAALLYLPQSVAVQGGGDIFIGDYFNYRVRKITNNHRPHFLYGRNQNITVCENSASISLNSLLSASDQDTGQTITWSTAELTTHAVLTPSFVTVTTGSLIVPGGLAYRPATGFSGTDSFAIEVCDGWLADTTIIHVTVVPVLSGCTISCPSDICIGTPVTCSASIPGGYWYTTYGARFSGPELAGTSPGAVMITYIVSNSCSVDTAMLGVNIWPVVTPYVSIAGRDTICQASTTTFTATTVNGGPTPVLQWQRNSRFTGIESPEFTSDSLADRDNISCIMISSAHCTTRSTVYSNNTSMVVHPRVIPTVHVSGYSGDLLCSGSMVTLYAGYTNGGAAPSLFWRKSGVIIGAGDTVHYIPGNNDIVTCELTSSAFCPEPATVADSTIPFVVDPLLTPFVTIHSSHDTTAYPGQIITFYAEETYGGSVTLYQWYLNGAPVAGATGNYYAMSVYSNDSVYCVTTSNLPCTTNSVDTSNVITLINNQLSVQDIYFEGSLVLFPNPNTGEFTLRGAVNGFGAKYQITDILGNVVVHGTVSANNGSIDQKFDLGNHLGNGQYFMFLQSDTGAVSMKFVILKE